MAVTLDLDASTQRINQKLAATRQSLVGIADGYEDIQMASRTALQGAVTDQDKLLKATTSSDLAFDRQGKTLRQLSAHLARLAKGQQKTNDPKLIQRYNTEIAKTQKAMQLLKTNGPAAFGAINKGVKASQVVFNGLRATIATTFGPLLAAGAIVQGIRSIISSVTEYEQIAADLQAITGAQGDTLEFLKQSAVEVGLETTVSAGQTLEAYKLIASAKPELLSNAEGLAAITREAITLAEAMGGELPEVATNLTDIMNQYQAPASEAARFTNALAAGSKEGSADVAQLAAAFLVAGTNLKSANVPLEEGVGLFEALAEQGKKGAEAGTAVRNVVAKLSATDVLPKDAVTRLTAAGVNMDLLSDKTLSFSDRLRALEPIQNDANALVSLFGLENLSAAQILLGATDRVDELTAAVTDTNVAYEQAAIRTSTASAEFARFRNTLEALIQGNGGGLSRFVGLLISLARQGLLFLGSVIESVSPVITGLVESMGGLFTAVRNLLPPMQTASGETSNFARVAQIVTVPIKLLIGLLTRGVTVFTNIINRIRAVSQSSSTLSSVFGFLRKAVGSLIQGFIDTPAVVVGAYSAIKSFIVDTASGIFNLGRNIGRTLKEAFSIRKLITQGTGDLNRALDDLLVNPFKGVGDNARKAFENGFNATKELLKIPVKTELDVSSEVLPVTAVPDPASQQGTGGNLNSDKRAEEEKKKAEKLARDIAQARVQALQDGLEKELALEDLRFNDLKAKLEKFNLDTTDAQIQHEQNKLDIKTKYLAEAADLDQLDGEQRIQFIYDQAKAEIDALESALTTIGGGSLTEQQSKQLALLRKKATDDYLKDLNALQDTERKEALAHEINLLELKRGEFDTQKDFEEFKAEEILKIRLKAAEEQLKIIEAVQGAESDAALSLRGTINSIRGDLAELSQVDPDQGFNLYSLFGLDPNDPKSKGIIEGIETAGKAMTDVLSEINAGRLEGAESAIQEADAQIAATQKLIEDAEKRLTSEEEREERGLANNKDRVLEEIELLKRQQAAEKAERQKAFNEKKRIQTQQAILDSITQGNSLLAASAQIYNSVAAIPFVGPIIGAGLVALMLGSFAAARARVFAGIRNQKAKKGYFGEVKGRRHSGGGERAIDHLEVEDGEAFGILSRQATKKYQGDYEAFTNAANKNDRKGMLDVAARLAGGIKVKPEVATAIEDKIIERDNIRFIANLNSSGSVDNAPLLRQILKAVRSQGDGTYYEDGKKVVKRGNFTRKSK